MKRTEILSSVDDLLHSTERTLGSMIEMTLGAPPELEVVAQWSPEAPLPPWVTPPFASDARVLGRCTGYRLDGAQLTHNLSYVDLGAVEAAVAEGLRGGRVHLGQLFLDPRIEKREFGFGTDADDPGLMLEFARHLDGRVGDLRPCAWRRYVAGMDGAASFVVIEALPIRVWGSLLSADERPRAEAIDG